MISINELLDFNSFNGLRCCVVTIKYKVMFAQQNLSERKTSFSFLEDFLRLYKFWSSLTLIIIYLHVSPIKFYFIVQFLSFLYFY